MDADAASLAATSAVTREEEGGAFFGRRCWLPTAAHRSMRASSGVCVDGCAIQLAPLWRPLRALFTSLQ